MKKNIHTLFIIFWLLFVTLGMSACVSLPEYVVHTPSFSELSPQESLLVFLQRPITPVKVDGQPLPRYVIARYNRVADVLRLSPGLHTLLVGDEKSLGPDPTFGNIDYIPPNKRNTDNPLLQQFMAFLFKPGLVYAVKFHKTTNDPQRLTAWIEQVGTTSMRSPDGLRTISLHSRYDPKFKAEQLSYLVEEAGATRGYVMGTSPLHSPVFSPDRKRIAFGTARENRWTVVIDGQEGNLYDDIKDIRFSPDSRRVLFCARIGEKWTLIVDDQAGWPYDNISFPRFSPDSQHIAFCAKKEGKWVVVVDGHESAAYDNVKHPLFSPDSKRVAFGAQSGKHWFVVIDGKAGNAYEHIFHPVFSPDSQRIAYYAQADDTLRVVIDDQEQTPHDDPALILLPENAYYQQQRYEELNQNHCYNDDFTPRFSPDSQRIAYRAVMIDRECFKKAATRDAILGVFIKDLNKSQGAIEARLACCTMSVVLDGQAGSSYSEIAPPLIFSPDSQQLVFRAEIEDQWAVIVNDKAGKLYDELTPPLISQDRKRIVFAAKSEQTDHQWCLVINGQQSSVCYADIDATSLRFSADGTTLSYIALRDKESNAWVYQEEKDILFRFE